MAKILVVGSLCLDYYDLGEGRPPLPFPGGKGGNQAVAAKRLGADVTLVAKVGQDSRGEFLLQNLEKEDLCTHFIEKKADLPTGYCQIQLATQKIHGFPGANLSWEAEDLAAILPLLCEVDCILLQFEIPPDFVYKLLEVAQALGKLVILNPAPPRQTQLPHLSLNTYLVTNRKEAHYYAQIPPGSLAMAQRAARELRKSAAHVAVTLGADGALVATGGKIEHLPALQVEAVDPIGAGDTFCAVLAVSLLEGNSLLLAARFASQAAAHATEAIGAQSTSP